MNILKLNRTGLKLSRRVVLLGLISFSISFMNLYSQQRIRDFELKNINNEMKSLEDLKGEQITIIDFWATWCKPCLSSIPKFNELYDEYSDKGLNIIGISIDSPRNVSKVKPFTSSLGIEYPILLDTNSELIARLNINAVPTMIMIDRQNNVLYYHEGFKPGDEKILRQKIDEYLSNL